MTTEEQIATWLKFLHKIGTEYADLMDTIGCEDLPHDLAMQIAKTATEIAELGELAVTYAPKPEGEIRS